MINCYYICNNDIVMTATVNIIKIGNSNGIILPAKILRALGVSAKDKLEISCVAGRAVLTSATNDPFAEISKGGWYEDPRETNEIEKEIRASRGKTSKVVEL